MTGAFQQWERRTRRSGVVECLWCHTDIVPGDVYWRIFGRNYDGDLGTELEHDDCHVVSATQTLNCEHERHPRGVPCAGGLHFGPNQEAED